MQSKRPPRDANELAKYIVDVTTGEADKIEPPAKNPHAQALSSLGASKGGQARDYEQAFNSQTRTDSFGFSRR